MEKLAFRFYISFRIEKQYILFENKLHRLIDLQSLTPGTRRYSYSV